MDSFFARPIISEVRHCTEPVREDFHYHLEYELIYIIKGTIEIEINKKIYKPSDGTLIFITNLDNHSVRQLSAEYDRYYVMLSTVPTDTFVRNPFLLNMLKNHTETFHHCIDVSPIHGVICEIFENLIRYQSDDILTNELISAYISQLLIHVCRLHPQQFAFDSHTWKHRILNIQTYLDIHYREKIRINEICQKYFLSSSCLAHQFTALTGYSPKQYLTMVRLKNAAIEIHNSERPISDIAMDCGFTDVNNFIKQFKRLYNCTPGQFRLAGTATINVDSRDY